MYSLRFVSESTSTDCLKHAWKSNSENEFFSRTAETQFIPQRLCVFVSFHCDEFIALILRMKDVKMWDFLFYYCDALKFERESSREMSWIRRKNIFKEKSFLGKVENRYKVLIKSLQGFPRLKQKKLVPRSSRSLRNNDWRRTETPKVKDCASDWIVYCSEFSPRRWFLAKQILIKNFFALIFQEDFKQNTFMLSSCSCSSLESLCGAETAITFYAQIIHSD